MPVKENYGSFEFANAISRAINYLILRFWISTETFYYSNIKIVKSVPVISYEERAEIVSAIRYVDEVIHPAETRDKIVKALDMLKNKEQERPFKKHGNIPL